LAGILAIMVLPSLTMSRVIMIIPSKTATAQTAVNTRCMAISLPAPEGDPDLRLLLFLRIKQL